jgi:hypothetical protein
VDRIRIRTRYAESEKQFNVAKVRKVHMCGAIFSALIRGGGVGSESWYSAAQW